jgi:hypothetical protein
MLQGQYFHILGATAVYVGIGWLWYSPYLFGDRKCQQHKNGTKKAMSDFSTAMAVHIVTALVTVTALCLAVKIFGHAAMFSKEGLMNLFSWMFTTQPEQTVMTHLRVVLFVWAGFLAPALACDAAYDGKCLEEYLVEAGGVLAMLTGAGIALAYLG